MPVKLVWFLLRQILLLGTIGYALACLPE